MRSLLLVVLTLSTLAVSTGFAGAALPEPRIVTVGTQFVPAVLVVAPGETVTWEGSMLRHTVSTAVSVVNAVQRQGDDPTNSDGDPDTFHAVLTPSTIVQHAFIEPGAHTYFCALHVGMVGTIIVVE